MTIQEEVQSMIEILVAVDAKTVSPRNAYELPEALKGLSEADDQLRMGGPLNDDEVDWRVRRGRAMVARVRTV